jgi:MFS family permease
VLLAIGAPGLLWALVILLIREPRRRAPDGTSTSAPSPSGAPLTGASPPIRHWRSSAWVKALPIYIVLAAASFADNAVGAWSPTLLIREFGRDPAQVGIELGLLLTLGFGGGVLIGGVLADRAAVRGGWSRKLWVCCGAGLLILPASLLMNSPHFGQVLAGVPLYFGLSGIVTAVGFSAILDIVPGSSRGLAMSMSFFLNVALGAGLGPTAVAVAAAHVFSGDAGLAPALVSTVALGYVIVLAALAVAARAERRCKSAK